MIAPFFSERARRRRAALKAAKAANPGSWVGFALRYPLEDLAEGTFRDPLILVASRTGIRIHSLDGSVVVLDASWPDISPLQVQFAPDPQLLPVLAFEVRGEPQRFLGAHSSGTFGLSFSQLQRMARSIERMRAAATTGGS